MVFFGFLSGVSIHLNLIQFLYSPFYCYFQEFRKEVENQLPLKEKVLSVGNQLLQNQVYQTADLEERLKHLELDWAHLEHDINNAEEYLHQAQMDLMPSRQALGELNAWLTEIEETLQEEKTKPMRNLADIEVLLKKYKVFMCSLGFVCLKCFLLSKEENGRINSFTAIGDKISFCKQHRSR